MPVVSRCIQILSGIVAVSRCPLIVVTFWLSQAGSVQAQETTETATPAAVADEAAPADDEPVPVQPQDPAIQQPAQNCMQKIIDQQALTRKIRDINNRLQGITDAEALKLQRGVSASIQSGSSTAADLANLTLVLQHRFFQMTDPAFVADPAKVQGLFRDMDREIHRAGSQAGNTQAIRSYRQKYCDAVLAVAKQLFDNNLDARFFAIHTIKLLYVEKTQAGRIENHQESLAALNDLLKDPGQPDQVKVTVAAGILYILSNMSVIPQQQAEVSDAIADELDRACTEPGYQLVLLETLFKVSIARKPVGPPVTTVMQTFIKIIDDQSRRIDVRCHAAFGIGQAAYDERINFDPIAFKLANLALDASKYFNQSPGLPAWQQCGVDLFFALRHEDKNGLAKKIPMLPQGILNRAAQSAVVSDSGKLIMKIAVPLVNNNAKIPQADQIELNNWIQANQALANKAWE